MSASEQQDHIPRSLGGDLPENARGAYQVGHDADIIPSNEGVVKPVRPSSNNGTSLGKDAELDLEMSSTTSVVEAGDAEKAQPEVVTADTTEEEQDPNVVNWDGPDDPTNPRNWSAWLKWSNIAVLSYFSLLTPLASSMFAPGIPRVMAEFGEHNESLATFVVSVYLLGFALGPLIVAPFSELYGRLICYHVGNIGFLLFTVACALAKDMNMLIAFRFLAGCWGVVPLTLGGGTIADLVAPEKRGATMAIWAMGPLLGPVIGPVAGGFLSDDLGWRWVFWVITIAVGVGALVSLIFQRETYAPTLLARKTKKLQKLTGNIHLRSKLDLNLPPKELFVRAIVRPSKLMFLSPICALMSLYMAIVYAILYLLFTTFTFVFEGSYGFSESTIGLVYLGLGIGNLIGLALLGGTSDRVMKNLAAKHNGGTIKPEYRLPPLMYGCYFLPAGLLIYGFTAQHHVHWAVPIFGTMLVGVGLIAAFMCINVYLIDTYQMYAASAMAANTVLRSILGALFPLFALQMYGTLGLGWGNGLLAFISLALCPIPYIFYYYGERLRTSPKWQVKF